MDRFWEHVTISGEAILYSGRTDGRHHERVANVLDFYDALKAYVEKIPKHDLTL